MRYISAGMYSNYSNAEENLRKMKKHGYDCVDYGKFINTDNDIFALDDAAFRSRMLEERYQIENAGLFVYQTHGPWRHPPKDETIEERAERMQKMQKAIWGTAFLGGHYMVIHPIMPFGTGNRGSAEEVWHINKVFFKKLLKSAEEANVIICLENMPFPEFSLSRPADIMRFVQEINSPWLKICLDTGHCTCLGESLAEAVGLFGNELKALHIHDNDGRRDLHWAPLRGVTDWDAFRKILCELPEEIPLNLETEVDDKLPEEVQEHFQIGLAKIARYLAN